MKRSLSDKLAYVAPPPSLAAAGSIVESVPDLQRILALPRRVMVDCTIDERTGRYKPSTQALIEHETAKFARKPRLSCACRPRKLVLGADGETLTIMRVLPPKPKPEAPFITTLLAFLSDNTTMGDAYLTRGVAQMQPGQELSLPAADATRPDTGWDCITELNPPQAWWLREAAQCGGAVGFMGVGSGKSIAFLLASLIFTDSRLAVLMIEAKQRQHYRSQYMRLREHFRASSIVCDVEVPGSTVPGTTPLHVISYSVLSRTENSDKLDRLEPDVLLLDEGHRACGMSAINRRVKRYALACIKKREAMIREGKVVRARALRLLTGSGTLEVKSVNDTQMLCTYALGTGSPLPVDPNEAQAWSAVMDASYAPDRTSQTSRSLHRYFGEGPVEVDPSVISLMLDEDKPERVLREGFQKWRTETPGIITASASDINASIYLGEFEVPKTPEVVKDALAKVRVFMRPDGEEIVEKLDQVVCARNVACGFYPYWAFPKHPCKCPADRTKTRSQNWCFDCQLIDDWYARRKRWNKADRSMLLKGIVKLDSSKLCEEAAERARLLMRESPTGSKVVDRALQLDIFCDDCLRAGNAQVSWPCVNDASHRPGWCEESWGPWAEIEGKVEYVKKVRWIGHEGSGPVLPDCPGLFLARAAAEWALKNKGVVWFDSVPLGRAIAELSGLPYFNGGPGGEDRLRAEKGNRSIICSVSAHGSGTDCLQDIVCDQILVEPPASNATAYGAEQILGRLHRRGQKADRVNTLVAVHEYELMDALRGAFQDAHWNFSMSKIRPKLLLADCDIEGL